MIVIDSHRKMLELWDTLRKEFDEHKYLRIDIKYGKGRTLKQNAALHKWCQDLADKLNAYGIDFRHFHKADFHIPFNAELVKDYIWRPVQKLVTGEKSTTKPTTEQYLEVYEIIARHLAERHNIICDWPTKEQIK